jgi:hypothetical protein
MTGQFSHHHADLVATKVWDQLGMTMDEFLPAWYAGHFDQDARPEVKALRELLMYGRWELAALDPVPGSDGVAEAATTNRAPT